MAARRGKSQARRNNGTSAAGMPGWAWLVLGVVLTIAVVLLAPKWMKSGGGDGFFRPKPNPDARPAVASSDEDGIDDARGGDGAAAMAAKPKPQYDFYKMLPGDEVQMSDAELAATEREEAARKAKAAPAPTAADAAAADTVARAGATAPTGGATVAATDAAARTSTGDAAAATRPLPDAPYILQAGAFGASGDAEATKAKVALLGLGARVESASINGKTVYRVRMGPYATASELAEAKRKLAEGGLPAMAIRAR